MMVFPRTDGTSYGGANPGSIEGQVWPIDPDGRTALHTIPRKVRDAMPGSRQCLICGSDDFDEILEIEKVPVHVGVVWPDAESATNCGRGDIRLAFCRECGFIYNVAFDERLIDYTLTYDNALGFSPTFQAFERDLCERLISKYDIRGKDVIELGAGSGRFLGLLCELGANRGLGFDPSHTADRADPLLSDRARVISGYYGEEDAGRSVDFLCCRHMLEHLDRPAEFLRLVRRNLAAHPDTVVYFEVPNAHLALREKSIWDVIYEHTSYYVPSSLEYAFRAAGFQVLDVYDCFSGQFAAVEARIDPEWTEGQKPARNADADLPALVDGYAREFLRMRETWNGRMREFREKGQNVVLWGGGAKAVSFISLVEEANSIRQVVDINPGKQGSFLGGGGQEIISPDQLLADPPDVVVVMNPVYVEEISAQIREMGLAPLVIDVAGGEARSAV